MDPTTTPDADAALEILIVADDGARAAIAAATRGLDVEVRLYDGRAEPDAPQVILVSVDDEERAYAVVAHHARETPTATIVALTASMTPDVVVGAMRAGAAEILELPLDPRALGSLLEKIAAIRRMPTPVTVTDGRVFTIVAPKEGVGATTLVANLGLLLARKHPQQVALVDLDLRNGDLALLLNIDPPQSLADLALGVDTLDAVFVHGSLVQHPAGISLLAASTERSREPAGLTGRHVEHVLTLLRAAHRVVLVDAPPPLSDAAVAAAVCADRVLVPTEPTVPSLRATWRTLEALGRLGVPAHALDVVVTRHEIGEAYLALDDITEALGRPVRHLVPREDDTAYRALNSGLPIASVRREGPLHHAIAALAATMMPTDDVQPVFASAHTL